MRSKRAGGHRSHWCWVCGRTPAAKDSLVGWLCEIHAREMDELRARLDDIHHPPRPDRAAEAEARRRVKSSGIRFDNRGV